MKTSLAVFIWLACVVPAFAGDFDSLQGAWRVIEASDDGEALSSLEIRQTDVRMVFKDNKFTLQSGVDKPGRFEFKLDESKTPKRIDFVAGANTLKGIYEVNRDSVRIAWDENPRASTAPRDFNHGLAFLLMRERPASELPQLEGVWKCTLMRDPEVQGVLLGERLAKRQIRYVFVGDVLITFRDGKMRNFYRYRINPLEPDDKPLRTITLFHPELVYDVAYEYDKTSLKIYFPKDYNNDPVAPATIQTSGQRLMFIPEEAADSFDGTWTVVAISRQGVRLAKAQTDKMIKAFVFKGDRCTWIKEGEDRRELSFAYDEFQSPRTMDFTGKITVKAIYKQGGDVMRVCFASPQTPDDRPSDFDSGDLTYYLVRDAGRPGMVIPQ